METPLPAKDEQVMAVHASLIRAVVAATRDSRAEIEVREGLSAISNAGWNALAKAIDQILRGRRDREILIGLDEEDRTIVGAILHGIENPASLPKDREPDPSAAAPALASLIQEACTGNAGALAMLAQMGKQMSAAGGEMARVAGLFHALASGERNVAKLTERLGPLEKNLVLAILDRLAHLEKH